MDRRTFLQASLAAAAAASSGAYAQYAAPVPAAAPPAFPPIDARSVWLVGDGAAPDAAATATRLATLLKGREKPVDQYLEKGAVAELEADFARRLGKEDCAFFPTGTLANNVALRVLCGEHRRALVQHESHVYRDEADAAQRLAGLNLLPLAPGRAAPTLEDVRTAFEESEHGPYPMQIGAISLESPVRRVDGALVPLEDVRAIATLACEHGARLHLDGARVLLAPPTFDLAAYTAQFDTVYVSLYKYLGAPFGAVLAGTKKDIEQARELRHVYGGALYQGWIPALLASDRLARFPGEMAQAHARGAQLVDVLVASGKVRDITVANASNIRRLAMAQDFADAAFERARKAGVRIGHWKDGNIPLGINTTLLRRPVGELAALFLG